MWETSKILHLVIFNNINFDTKRLFFKLKPTPKNHIKATEIISVVCITSGLYFCYHNEF